MRDSRMSGPLLVAGVLLLAACGSEAAPDGSAATDTASDATRASLGPVDGHDLPPIDLDRVQVGDTAPDFSLESYAGPVVTLSDFRGRKDVVLVFYRGHW